MRIVRRLLVVSTTLGLVAVMAGPAWAPPLECGGRPVTIVGTANADHLDGSGAGDDVIMGLGGNDYIEAGQGQDYVCGGLGADTIVDLGNQSGEGGHLWGDDGHDEIFGTLRQDQIFGEDGNDTMHGGPGADSLRGGNGADWLVGWGENDDIDGAAGDDQIWDGEGVDEVSGGPDSDYAYQCADQNGDQNSWTSVTVSPASVNYCTW